MGEKAIENRITRLNELGDQITALQEQAEAIRAELKADVEAKGADELKTKNFTVRWKEIVSSRLDGKALKAAIPDVYDRFCKISTSRRFTVTA